MLLAGIPTAAAPGEHRAVIPLLVREVSHRGPAIAASPPDEDINAALVLALDGEPVSATGEVSYPRGDVVDRVTYEVAGAAPGQAVALQVTVRCRVFGDPQLVMKTEPGVGVFGCGDDEVVEVTGPGSFVISARGRGPTHTVWEIVLRARSLP